MNLIYKEYGNRNIQDASKDKRQDALLPRSHFYGTRKAKLAESAQLPEKHSIERGQQKRNPENESDEGDKVVLPDQQHLRHPSAQQQNQIGGEQ